MSEPVAPKLRLGLLLSSYRVPAWVYATLSEIARSDYAEIVVVWRSESALRKSPAPKTARQLLGSYYLALDRAAFRPRPDALEPRDAGELLSRVAEVKVESRLPGDGLAIGPGIQNELRSQELDVILRLGCWPLAEEILAAAKFGVLTCQHGYEGIDNESPAGFWEVLEGRKTITSVMRVFKDDPANGTVIDRSYSKPHHVSVARNQNQLDWKAVSLFTRNLRRLHREGGQRFFERVSKKYASARKPHESETSGAANGSFLETFLRHLRRYIRLRWELFWYSEQWGLLIDFGDKLSCSPNKFNRLLPPTGLDWADPHVLYKNDKYYVFLEELPHETRKGHISVLELDPNGTTSPAVTIIEEHHHLAYPFVFEWQNDLWLIPDSKSKGSVDLYRCDTFPHGWSFHKTLMSGINAVDSTLLFHDDRWWLFANCVLNDGAPTTDELFLFSADNPLSDSWTEHPQSPVVSDVSRARSAGRIFRWRNELFRPAQICTPRYGYGIKFLRILCLTEDDYEEVEQATIEPTWDPGIVALHTFSRVHRLTMFDALFRRRRFALGRLAESS
jgi:hypothetical protein